MVTIAPSPPLINRPPSLLFNLISFSELLNNEDSKFSTWQLVHWESDVIIDPQLIKKEIIESNKKYAPHAGWIPSYKHRNMTIFQVNLRYLPIDIIYVYFVAPFAVTLSRLTPY